MRPQLVAVWEASVRATHHFLAPQDFEFFKDIVAVIDFGSFVLRCLQSGDIIGGFIGIESGKIEMLFIRPELFGRGQGKALLHYAIKELGATEVDVNEQNTSALRFYESQGFQQVGRTETDSAGKPYPILNLRLVGS